MEIHIGSRVAEIELLGKEDNLVRLSIDGQELEVDITMLEEGIYSILKDGESYNVELTHSDNRKRYKVNTHFSSYDVSIVDAKAKYLRLKKGVNERQDDKIISPMPGKVVNIPVKVGDRLLATDTAIVIEAMKMQNNYKVLTDCIVKEILVTEGETINSNQLLIRLDLTQSEK
ncbi:MAG: acetyl-CoA carboxylase biotin carboxyl carrier protein subunit [Massilibacteroides sp.]|nr:acetyl-CoA carboxylase biotin carboxyl carrier protein subunit [Massilibacteroides sp.]MDD3062612.1 acetyl-CoA carboxylase biotin carboxyl carrier protein subunit [Massilibacteroides sp.]MDD4660121.1 acetyl-CoA carboxylase biotin carboxyl carrier protein subunit [Massilibacteroides sp.]